MKYNSVATNPRMCYGCGFCKIICPTSAVEYKYNDEDSTILKDFEYAYKNLNICINCNRCHNICPSNGWKNSYVLKTNSMTEVTKGLEPFQRLCFCHANENNIRAKGTSGGMVTSVLKYLLEQKKIDGVMLPKYDHKLNASYQVMTSVENIISEQKSKYFCIPFDIPIKNICKYERLAMVGLPCHIEALNNITELRPEFKNKIFLKIGLFCGHVQKKIFYNHLLKIENIDVNDLNKLEFRPGAWWNLAYFNIIARNRSFTWQFRGDKYVSSLISSRLFSRVACMFCPDFTANNSDISFGDGWHAKFKNNKEGYNFAIIRSQQASDLISEMDSKNIVTIHESCVAEFINSSLFSNLLYKQYLIRKRIPFVQARDKNALLNIEQCFKVQHYIYTFIYIYIKSIAEYFESKNILHRVHHLNYFIARCAQHLLRSSKF